MLDGLKFLVDIQMHAKMTILNSAVTKQLPPKMQKQ